MRFSICQVCLTVFFTFLLFIFDWFLLTGNQEDNYRLSGENLGVVQREVASKIIAAGVF
jgi:hypothetical protein